MKIEIDIPDEYIGKLNSTSLLVHGMLEKKYSYIQISKILRISYRTVCRYARNTQEKNTSNLAYTDKTDVPNLAYDVPNLSHADKTDVPNLAYDVPNLSHADKTDVPKLAYDVPNLSHPLPRDETSKIYKYIYNKFKLKFKTEFGIDPLLDQRVLEKSKIIIGLVNQYDARTIDKAIDVYFGFPFWFNKTKSFTGFISHFSDLLSTEEFQKKRTKKNVKEVWKKC